MFVARPETVQKAITVSECRVEKGKISPDFRTLRILKRVAATGEADMETINKYRSIKAELGEYDADL